MSTEEEEAPEPMSTEPKLETAEPSKEPVLTENVNVTSNNENFVVLDTLAGESEESDKEVLKEEKEEINLKDEPEPDEQEEQSEPTEQASSTKLSPKLSNPDSENGNKPPPPEVKSPPATPTTTSSTTASNATNATKAVRKKPKAPVVDVNSLRKRKWQLKVYPLHAEDLQLSYVSILCKLASESLLYIPSEGRAGKAELYVATQKETAAIIGKLLRMEFHHKLLSIEVVRKDTGGKEEGDESKKECKAYLMFDKFLSKKIFDAKGEKGTLVEKLVTLNKLPKAATKDFIGALFPFATEIDIIESDDPAERKATVKCKTPVTSLLVYKSFKRLEINDVHVKLSVDDSVKAIKLPPLFFGPPPEERNLPAGSIEMLNKSSLPQRRPLITPLNRKVQQIRKRALLMRKKPTRGEAMREQRGMPLLADPTLGRRPLLGLRGPEPRMMPDPMRNRPAMRDVGPMGPGARRRMDDRQNRRTRERDSMERRGRRGDREESHVTKEMLQLQNQLNQAIKNQIAMLNTTSGSSGGAPMRGGGDSFSGAGAAHRAPLLGPGPRHFGDIPPLGGPGARGLDPHHGPDFGGSSWSADRGGRMDRSDRGAERERPDRQAERDRMARGERTMDRQNRSERTSERSDRIERSGRSESRPERMERGSRDRSEKGGRSSGSGDISRSSQRGSRGAVSAFAGSADTYTGRVKERNLNAAGSIPSGLHVTDPASRSSRSARSSEFATSGRSSRQNEGSYSSSSHTPASSSGRMGEYSSQTTGENGSYYRRY